MPRPKKYRAIDIVEREQDDDAIAAARAEVIGNIADVGPYTVARLLQDLQKMPMNSLVYLQIAVSPVRDNEQDIHVGHALAIILNEGRVILQNEKNV